MCAVFGAERAAYSASERHGAGSGPVSPGVTWEPWNICRSTREARARHGAAVLWFTGPPASGKSTTARELERQLFDSGANTMLLDGDQLRHGLSGDLGFSTADRSENVRRAGEVARLFFEHGDVVLCAFVSPIRGDRERVRLLFPADRFLEVFVDCNFEERRRRDTKGLYLRAAQGQLENLTGVTEPYEAPESPDFVARTDRLSASVIARDLVSELRRRAIIP